MKFSISLGIAEPDSRIRSRGLDRQGDLEFQLKAITHAIVEVEYRRFKIRHACLGFLGEGDVDLPVVVARGSGIIGYDWRPALGDTNRQSDGCEKKR